VKRRRKLPAVPSGSLADRIRTACPRAQGATLAEIHAVALALPDDVKAEVNRLRAAGYIRTYGHKRAMRYFWTQA